MSMWNCSLKHYLPPFSQGGGLYRTSTGQTGSTVNHRTPALSISWNLIQTHSYIQINLYFIFLHKHKPIYTSTYRILLCSSETFHTLHRSLSQRAWETQMFISDVVCKCKLPINIFAMAVQESFLFLTVLFPEQRLECHLNVWVVGQRVQRGGLIRPIPIIV